MGKITILPETTRNPITLIGSRAGCCWGADVSDDRKNYRRGIECIESGHGRVLEYANVEMILDGYSARVIREWYTHIGGSPSRLQASTRYIDYVDFQYVTPPAIKNMGLAINDIFDTAMTAIKRSCEALEKSGVPREDIAMLLPLGMQTKVVDKRNLRNLIDMSRQRMCNRAYWEFRELFKDILVALSDYSSEWDYICVNYMMPKCGYLGYCPEKHSCGAKNGEVLD